jgi:hypothetical protein
MSNPRSNSLLRAQSTLLDTITVFCYSPALNKNHMDFFDFLTVFMLTAGAVGLYTSIRRT